MYRNFKKHFTQFKFLEQVNKQTTSYLNNLKDKKLKVIDFKLPDELNKIFDFQIKDKGLNEKSLLDQTENIMKYSVNAGHSNFYNSLFGGFDEYSLAGDYVTSTVNGTMHSYEMAPVFCMMEKAIYRKYAELVHFDPDKVSGIFAPGGSMANFYGLLLARHKLFPNVKKEGTSSIGQVAVFTSELGHYSVEKTAMVLGVGLNNIIKVKCDLKGKMIPEELEKEIKKAKEKGIKPLMVNATVGTTVFGAIDPVQEISDICKKYNNIWLHVDGCFGGCTVFLEEYKDLIKGISQADSISFDPHKVLTIPMQCSIFITKHHNLLNDCNSLNADYLFMKDKVAYDSSLDTGDSSIQCGRHVDSVKLWLYLKGHGFDVIKEKVRHAINNAKYCAELVKKHPNFQLIVEPEFASVCFYYFPDRFLKREKDEKFWDEINKIAPLIKSKMMKKGSMMTSFQIQKQQLHQYKNFFRPILCVNKTKEDAEFIIKEIHELGRDL